MTKVNAVKKADAHADLVPRGLQLIGGMDERTLETNDLAVVDAELERKLPAAMAGSGKLLLLSE